MTDTFGARSRLTVGDRSYEIHRLEALADRFEVARLPYSLRILLENLLRWEDGQTVSAEDVEALAGWDPTAAPDREILFTPARVLLQDFTGVPAIVDLAAMRDAMVTLGGDPALVDAQLPADLVIDHSIIADVAGIPDAFRRNAELEFARNRERYAFLCWGQTASNGLRVVPPNTGSAVSPGRGGPIGPVTPGRTALPRADSGSEHGPQSQQRSRRNGRKTDVSQGGDRVWMALAIVLALFLSLTVGLTLNPALTAQPRGGGEGAGNAAGTSGEQTPHPVEVTLTEFSIAPAELSVPAGTPLTFTAANAGVAEHDFTIDGVAGTETVAAGGTATLEVDTLEPGNYQLLCTIAGHDTAGMEGTLTVAEDAVPVPAPTVTATPDEYGAAGGEHAAMSPEEMARLHDEGVAAFPVETEGRGNQPLEPEVLADGTKVFELTADEIDWETKPGVVKAGMAYNGQIPGPQLHADLGDRVRIVLHNELDEPTALHSHGLILPNGMDGVPGLTQPSILPGESFTYQFQLRNAGSHMYHSHFNAAEQVTSGLLGAFIVHGPTDPPVDQDYVLIANDGPLGHTLNGKDFPATEPIVAQQGDLIRIRYMNEGLQIHPMHLHGLPQQVIAKDGYPLPQPHFEDTVLVAPGERVDVLVEASEVGAWALHCHIFTHAEGPEGMFGLVTVLIVEE